MQPVEPSPEHMATVPSLQVVLPMYPVGPQPQVPDGREVPGSIQPPTQQPPPIEHRQPILIIPELPMQGEEE